MSATTNGKHTGRVTWIGDRRDGVAVTRIVETPGSRTITDYAGRDHDIAGTRITAYAGDEPIITVYIDGSHPATRANYREAMARRVQQRGGSWLGRTTETETRRADEMCLRMHDPAVTPRAADRLALQDAYYGTYPGYVRPSTY